MDERVQILLTNDDGIQSPGLWAAASALSKLGYVTVVAPREQASGTGRSMPRTSDGKIERTVLNINGQDWPVYSLAARRRKPCCMQCSRSCRPYLSWWSRALITEKTSAPALQSPAL